MGLRTPASAHCLSTTKDPKPHISPIAQCCSTVQCATSQILNDFRCLGAVVTAIVRGQTTLHVQASLMLAFRTTNR